MLTASTDAIVASSCFTPIFYRSHLRSDAWTIVTRELFINVGGMAYPWHPSTRVQQKKLGKTKCRTWKVRHWRDEKYQDYILILFCVFLAVVANNLAHSELRLLHICCACLLGRRQLCTSTIVECSCLYMCVLTGLRDQAIWPNYKVVMFQASVSDCSIPRLCCYGYHFYSSPSAPQILLPFSGSFIPFLPPPGPIPYRPPSSTRRRHFSLSLHPLLPIYV